MDSEDDMEDLHDRVDKEVSESESESESDSEEDVELREPSKNSVYDRDGMVDRHGDIAWPEDVDWIQKLSIDIDPGNADVNDDLTRELTFYTQALEGANVAFQKLQSLRIPFLRPSDYYAEMVKSDTHMEKVKGRLLSAKKKIEEADERRKAREAKRIAKEVQAQKLKERAKQKKEEIESVKKWRKQRQRSGFAGGNKDGEMDLPFTSGKPFEKSKKMKRGVAPGDRSGGKGKNAMNKKLKKREMRNSKFGYGGRKGLKKQNTAASTEDFRSFKQGTGNKKRKKN